MRFWFDVVQKKDFISTNRVISYYSVHVINLASRIR